MNKKKPVLMWVYPEFKRKMEIGAVLENKSLISMTRDLSHDEDMITNLNNRIPGWKRAKKNEKYTFWQ